MSVFVTAIHTDSGKTLISAIICMALKMDYWKPVQAGVPTDANTIRTISSGTITIHPEQYLLKTPESPHAAAKKESIAIRLEDFALPKSKNGMVVEGAGGCLVPLNDRDFVIDIASRLHLPVVVISNFYLGSINHTLLTLEALRRRNIAVKGIVFNGKSNVDSERIILQHAGAPCLLKIPQLPNIDKDSIEPYVKQFYERWRKYDH
jgi:dethiobiotin synthetase